MSAKKRSPRPLTSGSWKADWEAAKPIILKWIPVVSVVGFLAALTYMNLTH